MARKVFWSGKLEVGQLERLKALNERTRVPVAEFVRQGVDLVLRREEAKVEGQRAALRASAANDLDQMLVAAARAGRRARKGRAA